MKMLLVVIVWGKWMFNWEGGGEEEEEEEEE